MPPCECVGNPGFFSRGFAGTPTIRIVISGLPASYTWSDFFSVSSVFQKNDWTLTGLNSINGTYFLGLAKAGLFCIDEPATPGAITSSNYTEAFARSSRSGPNICIETSTSSGSASKNAGPTVTFVGTQFIINLNQSATNYYGFLGEVRMSCPSYDYTTTSGNNSITGGFASPRTWPRSSGEIKILRRAIADGTCGFTPEHASGQVFATIGTLTAEIVDL